ncbi:cathepsin L.1 precursor, partial [Silurus meridionalis]
MKILIIITSLVGLVSPGSVYEEDLEFDVWKLKFGENIGIAIGKKIPLNIALLNISFLLFLGKIYKTVEEEYKHKMTRMENRKLVLAHNILADQGIKSYRLGMTF